MKNKILIIVVILMTLGLYLGIDTTEGICNGPYKQRAVVISYIKPFIPEIGRLYLGFGNKHYDYERVPYNSSRMDCVYPETGSAFGPDDRYEGEEFEMVCKWVPDEGYRETGCATWYNKYEGRGDIIDLVPFLEPIYK